MAFIQTIEPGDASPELAEVYAQVGKARGVVANILKIHSVHPRAMLAHLGLYMELMFASSELSRAEREMIAVAVSVTNQCHY